MRSARPALRGEQRQETEPHLLGGDPIRPEGAYYTMADFTHLGRGKDDTAFAYWLIDEIGVATVPGSSFYVSDPSLGRGLIRFAFPKKDETLDLVEKRLQRL